MRFIWLIYLSWRISPERNGHDALVAFIHRASCEFQSVDCLAYRGSLRKRDLCYLFWELSRTSSFHYQTAKDNVFLVPKWTLVYSKQ